MLNKKKGYTLAEVLVVLTLLGILAAILLPAVAKIRPDRDKMMFKKAYYVAERVIYEIVNDDEFYPTYEGNCEGFECTTIITIGGNSYGASGNTDDSENKQKTKFCGLFAKKVNTNVDIKGYKNDNYTDLAEANINGCKSSDVVPSANGVYSNPSFYTSDGIAWYMPASNFEKADNGDLGEAVIYVDVNAAKKPNCLSGANGCSKPDIFKIHVVADGKVYVDGEKESKYLESHDNVR